MTRIICSHVVTRATSQRGGASYVVHTVFIWMIEIVGLVVGCV